MNFKKQMVFVFIIMLIVMSINIVKAKDAELIQSSGSTDPKPFVLMQKDLRADDSTLIEYGEYDKLHEAIGALDVYVKDSKEYILYVMKDCKKTQNEILHVMNNVNLTIKSFGDKTYTITAESNNKENPMMFSFTNSNIRIENIILDGGNNINCFDITENSQVTIGSGVTIQNFKETLGVGSDFHAPIEVSSGTLIIEDGATIKDNKNAASNKKAYGVIYSDDVGTIEIKGGTFEKNSSTNLGGLIMSFGNVSISGGNFTNNSSSTGGVIAAYNKLNITGGTFEGNKAINGTGGAISLGKNVDAKISNCTFKDNNAKWGGAIYTQKESEIINTRFESNTASISGGAIYSTGKLTVDNSKFISNKSISSSKTTGGAINIGDNSDENKISNTQFEENISIYGGAIYLNKNSKVEIDKSNFKKNEAAYGAGISTAKNGVNKDRSNIKITESTFEENKALLGAGVFTAFPTEIEKTKFIKNYADVHEKDDKTNPHNSGCGGALYIVDNKITIKKSEFIENGSFGSGGAICISGVNRDDDGNITTIKSDLSVEISDNTKFEKNEVKVGQGGAIYTSPYQYAYNITDENAYKNLKTDNTTLFLNNKSGEGLFVPPTNYQDFTDLKFSDKSDVEHEILSVKSLLNNYDINYKNEKRTIIFDANGGKFSDGETIKTDIHDLNSNIKIMEAPTREGYEFDYWKGSKYNPNDDYTVIENHKFVAQWKEKMNPGHFYEPSPDYLNKKKPDPVQDKKYLEAFRWYVKGNDLGLFMPTKGITRAEVAQMFARALEYDNAAISTVLTPYTDVNANAWYYNAVQKTSAAGIFKGTDKGTFEPLREITQAELISTIARFQKLTAKTGNTMALPENHWATPEVEAAYAEGWLDIYTKGIKTFNADQVITREEVVTILNRGFGRQLDAQYIDENVNTLKTFPDATKDMWSYYEILTAANTYLVDKNWANHAITDNGPTMDLNQVEWARPLDNQKVENVLNQVRFKR